MLEKEHKNVVQGKGNIWVSVVADSINLWDDRLTTFRLHYPRFIHAEFMTHRMFSRNASSSRAIPVVTMLDQVRNNPAMPIHWGKNQGGMQADGEHNADVVLPGYFKNEETGKSIDQPVGPDDAWVMAAGEAAYFAEAFATAGYHKQVANRLLEPFQFMNTVMSTTDIDNFFWLRVHEDADPNIQELAKCMLEAFEISQPELLVEGEYHTPYVDHVRDGEELLYFTNNEDVDVEDAKKISTSCAAQSSYRKLDTSLEKALGIYDRLVGSSRLHASPFEHVATPFSTDEYITRSGCISYLEAGGVKDTNFLFYKGNFRGWSQFRKTLPGENMRHYF